MNGPQVRTKDLQLISVSKKAKKENDGLIPRMLIVIEPLKKMTYLNFADAKNARSR